MAGFDKVIGFDMGGTSTDVSHYDGEYERAFETEVAGVRMRAPMMRIHTVAAGGGSILHYRRRRASASARIPPAPIPARLLPPRRTADRHRRQRHARQAATRIISRGLRPQWPTSRSTPTWCAKTSLPWQTTSATDERPEEVADGFLTHRRREHGQRHQEDLGAARL